MTLSSTCRRWHCVDHAKAPTVWAQLKRTRLNRFAIILPLILLGIIGPRARGAGQDFTYANPLPFEYESQGTTTKELRDPCIIHVEDTYYLVFTMYPFRNYTDRDEAKPDLGSPPGIYLYSTKDFKKWDNVGWLVKSSDLPADCPYKHQFWAPEIHHIGNKFYIIFAGSNWDAQKYGLNAGYYGFIGVADKVTGPYEHITQIPNAPCDTSLFTDETGQFYLVLPRQEIFMQKVDLSQLDRGIITLLGSEIKVVDHSSADIGQTDSPRYLEGPWVERTPANKYMLFYAENFSPGGYWTGVAYADHPMGPYTKDSRAKVFMGGQVSIFAGPDGRNWFAYRKEREGPGTGQLAIDPLEVDSQGKVISTDTAGQQETVLIKAQ